MKIPQFFERLKVVKLFRRIREWFVKPGLYLVFECSPERAHATLARYDIVRKEVRALRHWMRNEKVINLEECTQWMQGILRSLWSLDTTRIVIGLDPRWAMTMHTAHGVLRHQSDQLITEGEIEEVIDNGLRGLIESERAKINRLLNISEVSALPVDGKVISFQLDGHSTVNPLGLKGKRIEIGLRVTFMPKEVWDGIQRVVPRARMESVAETGVLIGEMIGRSTSSPVCFLASVRSRTTTVYGVKPECRLIDQFEWGGENLVATVSSQLSLTEEIAQLIISDQENVPIAPELARRLEQYTHPELQFFHRGLTSSVPKVPAVIYVYAASKLPQWLFDRRYQTRWWQPWKLESLTAESIYNVVGFRIKYKQSVTIKNPIGLCVLLQDQFSGIPAEFIQRAIKRRVHWYSST